MRIVTAQDIDTAVAARDLVETLRRTYRSSLIAPPRESYTIDRPGGSAARLSLMPAWTDFAAQESVERGYIGVTIMTEMPIAPDASGSSRSPGLAASAQTSSQTGAYLLLSGTTGVPIALIDGPRLTEWRSAGLTALAASYLAREDCERLLVLGGGAQAILTIDALLSVRTVRQVLMFGASPETVQRATARFARAQVMVRATDDLEGAVRGADIICRLPGGPDVVLPFGWLQPGCHVDLGEGQSDDEALLHEARAFAESREATNIISPLDLAADLGDLARGERAGRRYYNQITAFAAGQRGLADLACAGHVFLRS